MQHQPQAETKNSLFSRLFHTSTSGLLVLSLLGCTALAVIQTSPSFFTQEAQAVPRPPAKKAAPAPKAAEAKKTEAPEVKIPDSEYLRVSPTELLKDPKQFMSKHVDFVGVFNRFSDTGLDYKKAFRDSRDYVSLFILRPDVEPHKIPLSELKLFFPRKKSEEVLNLESGDTIRIKGTVFGTALNEPWVDINEIKVLQKTKEENKKPTEECC